MKKFFLPLALVCIFATGSAAAAPSAWVQATANGFEARIVPQTPQCPAMQTDKGPVPMRPRAEPSAAFPLLCAAPIAPNVTRASIGDSVLPLPVMAPTRILVLGDTGCRLKGAALQACNDPRAWPFPQVAAAAARLKPQLVIHLGDYLYRESACPAGNAGCAGSPWGDNWNTWKADFFDPAQPLLAAAPIVLARGNHEDCNRAGAGWLRLQGPQPFDPGAPCVPHLPLYTVDLGDLRLAVMDDATADDVSIVRRDVPAYAAELAGLAEIPAPVWFVHHRPIWGAVTGPLGIPVGGNLTLIQAAQQTAAPAVPPNVELMLSGHLHTFEAINYAGHVPPQIVAGNGGDDLLVTPKNLRGTQFQGHSGVTVADGLSVGGFGFLLMSKAADGWTIDLYDPSGALTRQCRFTNGKPGRLDCQN
jgi:hypothetical protein